MSISEAKRTPGPGSYDDGRTLHYKTLAGSKMGKDNRASSFLYTPAHGKPDPGKYEPVQFAAQTLGAPKYGCGSEMRFKDH